MALVRLWSIDDDEHYILPVDVPNEDRNRNGNSRTPEKAVCMAYNARKRTLAVGTRGGYIVQWRSICAGAPSSDAMWEALPPIEVSVNDERGAQPLHAIERGPGEKPTVTVLSETQLGRGSSSSWIAVQKSA